MGLSLYELNVLLQLNSNFGKKYAGSTLDLRKNKIMIGGFTQRQNGVWGRYGSSLGVLWDINDTILGYQGEIDAIGREFIAKFRGQHIDVGYSIGALRSNNLMREQYASSASLYALPFGNIRSNNTSLQIGSLDIISGGRFGALPFNFGSIVSSPSYYNFYLNHKLGSDGGYNIQENNN